VNAPRGRLIVFEGPEGAGKTTQLRRLGDWLTRRGIAFTGVREPGGTALGNEIRRLLLLDPTRSIDPRAEALLFMASRAELTGEVILPALARGEIVLADRFFLSTYAYQIAGRGLSETEIRAANMLATRGLVPHLTVLFEVRSTDRRRRAELRGAPDRMEQAGADFHTRVEQAFAMFVAPDWQIDHPECGPIVAVDGEGTEAQVFERVMQVLAERWPETFSAFNESHP
jgi:dTMP kinase